MNKPKSTIWNEKVPVVRIDNSQKKHVSLPVFQEALNKANVVLAEVGLPPKSLKIKR